MKTILALSILVALVIACSKETKETSKEETNTYSSQKNEEPKDKWNSNYTKIEFINDCIQMNSTLSLARKHRVSESELYSKSKSFCGCVWDSQTNYLENTYNNVIEPNVNYRGNIPSSIVSKIAQDCARNNF